MTVSRACERRGNNASYSFANAMRDCVSPETQTTVAGHAHRVELRPRQLKLSDQVDLMHWHSERIEDTERDKSASFPMAPVNTQRLWVFVCRLQHGISHSVADTTVRSVCKVTASTSSMALPTQWTGVLFKTDRRWWQNMQNRGESMWLLQLSRESHQMN